MTSLLSGDEALAAIDAVRSACREYDGNDPLDEAAGLDLSHRGLPSSAWVRADGFALRRGDALDLAVAPAARGTGVGGSLAEAACAEPGALMAWSHGVFPAADRLASRLGFSRVRELLVLRRPAAVLPEVGVPAGVHIRSFTRADSAALLAVNAAAFASHPEQGSLDEAGLSERMAEPWFSPEGLLLAVDSSTGELLGFHWTKMHDARQGEIYVLGVSPAAQGRQLGKALALAGLAHLSERGAQEVLLYVEASNTPARRLYEGLGFNHAPRDTHVQYGRLARLE